MAASRKARDACASAQTSRRRFLSRAAAAGIASGVCLGQTPASWAAQRDKAPIVAGQIGVKHSHASGKLEAMRRLAADYRVAGIVEPDAAAREAAQKNKAYAELQWLSEAELLAQPGLQVVAVETTLADSTPAALRMIEAGKHIHLDKPGGADHAAFKQMRLLAQERKLTVQMGYMLRYNPALELLFRAVREGWLGDITEVNANMGKLAGDGARQGLAAHPGHGMFELACHVIDAVVTILGRPEKITPFGKSSRAADRWPDVQLAVFEYPKALAVIRCHHSDPDGFARRAFEVIGTAGSLAISPLESGRGRLFLTKPCGDFDKGAHDLKLTVPAGRYDGEFADLARVVRGEKALAWSAAHDVAVHETALRAAGLSPG